MKRTAIAALAAAAALSQPDAALAADGKEVYAQTMFDQVK